MRSLCELGSSAVVEHLPGMCQAFGSNPELHKPGVRMLTCNSSPAKGKVEAVRGIRCSRSSLLLVSSAWDT